MPLVYIYIYKLSIGIYARSCILVGQTAKLCFVCVTCTLSYTGGTDACVCVH